MGTMKAVVFKGKERIAVEEVAPADGRVRRSGNPHYRDHDLRYRMCTSSVGNIPCPQGRALSDSARVTTSGRPSSVGSR